MCTNPCNHAFDLDGSSTWRTTLRVGKNFCKYGSYAALVVLLAANALNDVAGLEAHLVGWIQAVVSLGGTSKKSSRSIQSSGPSVNSRDPSSGACGYVGALQASR